ncbi:MAG: branched-chain amino acid ABC transporter substrate-binding protein [Chloroflexi bacterium]|nr:branched-chain amino acid ABC transporter substrate-binding protein [Chloroflexota bacterium]
MNRKIALALAALLLTNIFCGPTPTPATNPPPPQPGVPSGSNQAVVNGSSGTSADGIPVNCEDGEGNVNIPAGSFSGTETITIECISESEKAQLDQAVENSTGQTGEVLGVIKLSPSGMQFDSFVTITIPLIQFTSAQYVDVYIYDDDNSSMFEEVLQAQVDCSGLCAKASVDHFTTFIAYEMAALPTEEPITYTCTDPLGCVNYAPGESIRIATLLTYSGENGFALEIAAANEDGIRTALQDYGDIGGHGFDLTTFDEGCDSDLALASAERIISDPSIAAVIGTVCSPAAEAAMQYISKYGYSMISPANTRTSLTEPGSHQDGYFRISAPDNLEARGMAIYAYKELELRYVSIVYEDSNLSRELAATFSDQFLELGGKILDNEEYSDPAYYFAKLSAKIASGEQRPDAIYMPMPSSGGNFAGAISGYEYYGDGITLLGHSSMTFNDKYVESSGIGKYLTYYPTITPDYASTAFDFGYDAAALLIDAIISVVETDNDGTLHIGRQALRNALTNNHNFHGRTGNLSCNQYGDCGAPMIEIYRYTSISEFDGNFEKSFEFHP